MSVSDVPGVPVVGSPATTAIGAGHFLLLPVVLSVIGMGALTLKKKRQIPNCRIKVNDVFLSTATECEQTPRKIGFEAGGSHVQYRNIVIIPIVFD